MEKFDLMSEPALKCENNTIFKQNYILKLFIAHKMSYSCCFSWGGNLDFPEFLQKSFITSTTGEICVLSAAWKRYRTSARIQSLAVSIRSALESSSTGQTASDYDAHLLGGGDDYFVKVEQLQNLIQSFRRRFLNFFPEAIKAHSDNESCYRCCQLW